MSFIWLGHNCPVIQDFIKDGTAIAGATREGIYPSIISLIGAKKFAARTNWPKGHWHHDLLLPFVIAKVAVPPNPTTHVFNVRVLALVRELRLPQANEGLRRYAGTELIHGWPVDIPNSCFTKIET